MAPNKLRKQPKITLNPDLVTKYRGSSSAYQHRVPSEKAFLLRKGSVVTLVHEVRVNSSFAKTGYSGRYPGAKWLTFSEGTPLMLLDWINSGEIGYDGDLEDDGPEWTNWNQQWLVGEQKLVFGLYHEEYHVDCVGQGGIGPSNWMIRVTVR